MKTMCHHGHRKCRCAKCGGKSCCPHGRAKYQCVECKGNGVCEHLRQRAYCPLCSPKGVYRSYKNSARKRDLGFALTFGEFVTLLYAPCVYCGQSPALGIDRADATIGYALSNCLSCCATDNIAKQSLNPPEYLAHVAKVYKFQQGDITL